jgi:hypothetical protein
VILTADTVGDTGVPAESAYTTMFCLCSGAATVAAVLGATILPRARRRQRAREAVG